MILSMFSPTVALTAGGEVNRAVSLITKQQKMMSLLNGNHTTEDPNALKELSNIVNSPKTEDENAYCQVDKRIYKKLNTIMHSDGTIDEYWTKLTIFTVYEKKLQPAQIQQKQFSRGSTTAN